MFPPVFNTQHPRSRRPVDFLSKEQQVHQVHEQLSTLEGTSLEQWNAAHDVIRNIARQFSRDVKPMEEPRVLPLLLGSCVHCVSQQGWNFVLSQGLEPTLHAKPYSRLVSLYERHHSDKVGSLLLAKLKGLLVGDSSSQFNHKKGEVTTN